MKKGGRKVRILNEGSKSTAAPIRRDDATPKQWRPPLSEIRENVTEILRQRPDQLKEMLAGRLDPGQMHGDFLYLERNQTPRPAKG